MSEEKIDTNEYSIHSEYAQEILETPPSSLIRYGSVGIFIIVGLMLLLCHFVKYSDVIKGEVVITSINAPQKFNALSNITIDSVFVENEQFVRPNDIILLFKNTTNFSHYLHLKSQIQQDSFNSFIKIKDPILGDLQSPYIDFVRKLDNYQFYVHNGYRKSNIDQSKDQEAIVLNLIGSLNKKKRLKEKELKLAQEQLDRNTILHNNGIISLNELNASESAVFTKSSAIQDISTSISQARIQLSEIRKSILNLKSNSEEGETNVQADVSNAFELLKNEIERWEKNYTITSNIRGFISLSSDLGENVSIASGKYLLAIVPESEKEIIGKVLIPVDNAGKIEVGQKANVKLSNYSYHEFGIIKGRVKSISIIPNEKTYSVILSLPQELITTQTSITYTPEMYGEVSIITEDLSVLERIFYQLRSLAE